MKILYTLNFHIGMQSREIASIIIPVAPTGVNPSAKAKHSNTCYLIKQYLMYSFDFERGMYFLNLLQLDELLTKSEHKNYRLPDYVRFVLNVVRDQLILTPNVKVYMKQITG